jgi:hypothetical protein
MPNCVLLRLLLLCRLANEITNLSDAATLYPLFGLGANLAQAIAGLVLKVTVAARNWQLCDASEDLVHLKTKMKKDFRHAGVLMAPWSRDVLRCMDRFQQLVCCWD